MAAAAAQQEEEDDEEARLVPQEKGKHPRKAAEPKRHVRDKAPEEDTESGNPSESQISVAATLSETARSITEGQQAMQAAAKHATGAQVPALQRIEDDYQLPSVRITVGWIKKVWLNRVEMEI